RFRHHGTIACLAVSPDGKLAATASDLIPNNRPDHSIRLFDTGTGKELRQFRGPTDDPAQIVFSPDGHLLASIAYESACAEPGEKIRLWDVATGKQLHVLDSNRLPPETGWSSGSAALAISPD